MLLSLDENNLLNCEEPLCTDQSLRNNMREGGIVVLLLYFAYGFSMLSILFYLLSYKNLRVGVTTDRGIFFYI